MYNNEVLQVQWHHAGIILEKKARLKSFVFKGVRIAEPEVDMALTGKSR